MSNQLNPARSESEESWISVSDLMAGLMMVFLLIAVLYASEIKKPVKDWQDAKQAIVAALLEEFKGDLEYWEADIDEETLTVHFLSPKVHFKSGSAAIEPPFEKILEEFIPRYMKLLQRDFKDTIREVRIDGHASSVWEANDDPTVAFLRNMDLSQARAREVLVYSMNMPEVAEVLPWMRETVSANGFSSARQELSRGGIEDHARSRRVEFTIKTKTEDVLDEVAGRNQ